MPSYADMNGAPGSPANTITSAIHAGYYTTDLDRASASGERVRLSSSLPPGSCGALKTAKVSQMKTTKVVPMGQLGSSSAKYEKLVDSTGVIISQLPAKLQPMFSRFDTSGDGIVDMSELGIAAELYQKKKDRRKLLWLQCALAFAGILALAFILAYASKSSHKEKSGCESKLQTSQNLIQQDKQRTASSLGDAPRNATSLDKLERSTIESMRSMLRTLEAMQMDPKGMLAELDYSIESLDAASGENRIHADEGDAIMILNGKAFRLRPSKSSASQRSASSLGHMDQINNGNP